MLKNKLIVVDGPQGVGKTALTTQLREKITCTTLIRLSGASDKSALTAYKSHKSTLDMIESQIGIGMNFVLDRSHFSEEVYCKLGYKSHDFTEESNLLSNMYTLLTKYYNVYVVVLTANATVLDERLKRDKPQYLDVKFDVKQSLLQANTFIYCVKRFNNTAVKRIILDTSNMTKEEVADYILLHVN